MDSTQKKETPGLDAGLRALRDRNFPLAREQFSAQAEKGDGQAMAYLGLIHLRALGTPYDPVQAFEWTERAARMGLPSAELTLAHLCYLGIGSPRNPGQASRLLLASARSGHAPALRTLGLVYLGLGSSWHGVAERCLEAASAQRDLFAVHAIALGRLTRGETARALPLLAWAGTQGFYPSLLHLKRLQASLGLDTVRHHAIAEPDYPSRPHVPDLPEFPWEPEAPSPSRMLDPRIGLRIQEKLLETIECDYLIALAVPALRPSETREPGSGRIVKNPIRTSSAMNFPPNLEDLVVFRLEERIAAWCGLILAQAEPLAVLRYRPGEEYRPHFDAFDERTLAADTEGIRLGQRTVTALTYLNADFTDGGTGFPALGVTIRPEAGQILAFSNLDSTGARNPLALHAGQPVGQGEKWLATLWFRERPGARQPDSADPDPSAIS